MPLIGSGADIAKEKKINADNYGTNSVVTGTKYSRFGNRDGFGSALDKNVVKQAAEAKRAQYGDGAIKFQLLDAQNKPAVGSTMNFGGRIFQASADGFFRVVDGDYLDEIEKQHEEREEYVLRVLRACLVNNTVCADVLGMPQDKLVNEFLVENMPAPDIAKEIGMPKSLWEANANIDLLSVLSGESKEFALGVAKLKCIVAAYMPVIDNFTAGHKPKEGIAEKVPDAPAKP